MIINGYIRPFLSEQTRAGALYKLGVLYKDFRSYMISVTETLKAQIETMAAQLDRPVFIPRWLVMHSTILHAPMFSPSWDVNRPRGFREKQSVMGDF